MRIAVSGAAGTGKSTLCKLISANTGLELIPEINDLVLQQEMGYQTGEELFAAQGEEGMIDWHMRSLKRKIMEDVKKDDYVADKSLFDNVARWYARMYPKATPEQHEIMRSALDQFHGIYDRIIFLPLNLDRPVIADGLRTTDLNQRSKFNLVLKGLYSQYRSKIETYEFNFTQEPSKVLSDIGLGVKLTK